MALFGAGGKKAGKSLMRGLRTGSKKGASLDLSPDEILDEALLPLFRDVELPPENIGRGRQQSLIDDGVYLDEAAALAKEQRDLTQPGLIDTPAISAEEAGDKLEEGLTGSYQQTLPDHKLSTQMLSRGRKLEVPEPRTEGPFLPQDAPPKVETVGERVKLSDKEIDALTHDDIQKLIPHNRMGDYDAEYGHLEEGYVAEWFRNERDDAIELYKGLSKYAKERNMDLVGLAEVLTGVPGNKKRMQYLLDTFDMDGSLKLSLQQEADKGVPF